MLSRRRLSDQATLYAYKSLAAFLESLPRPVATGVAALAGVTLAELWRSRRPVVRRNLRRVLGPEVGEATLDKVVARAFDSYARYWVESATLGGLRNDEVDAAFSIEGFEALRLEVARGQGALVALPHVGSWEVGGRWLAQQGYPMTTVGELLEPPELFEWFTSKRASLGLTVLPPGPKTTVRLLDTLRDGGVVGLLADRDVVGSGVSAEFFGEVTTLPGGPALLALRSGAPIFTCAIYQEGGGRYHAIMNPPISPDRSGRLREDVMRLTATVTAELEGLIRRAPEQWHLFQPNWPSDRECAP